MNVDLATIHRHLERAPFRPFEVITSAGDRYEVRNPAMAWLLPSRLFIALQPVNGSADRVAELALLHIVGIEERHETGR